ncbi:hypothetical protein PAN31117_00157 [Pandoraea anapnoica]|uniref:CopL family metal-binding regulatory protein n=2 Tax=Pandoraea anapnoica TaxID=2508301 RepID=A0A5E4ZIG6_9BURK|nr:hypothetical protein PAN31117_00157 [Pandoraea anapnoica]
MVRRMSICERRAGDARLRSMNRWRKLLVLLLLCVTMPLQAMAALRTHCAPGSPAASMQRTSVATVDDTPTMAMDHATMSGDAMSGMHHHSDKNAATVTASDTSDATHASSHTPQTSHNQHASCSACAACVVCTALPQSVVLRVPDAQPSAAIPFLRTSATSAIVAVLERPPKALAV